MSRLTGTWQFRSSLPEAILCAITAFNQRSLCHLWPRYFPKRPPTDDCFKGVEERTIDLVHGERVIQSVSGKLTAASSLFYVSPRYQDSQGLPLLSTRISTLDTYPRPTTPTTSPC